MRSMSSALTLALSCALMVFTCSPNSHPGYSAEDMELWVPGKTTWSSRRSHCSRLPLHCWIPEACSLAWRVLTTRPTVTRPTSTTVAAGDHEVTGTVPTPVLDRCRWPRRTLISPTSSVTAR